MRKYLPLSVFFPAYNEEGNIRETVERTRRVVHSISPVYEIIIVNDGSSDRTGEIAERLAAEDPAHVRVVHHRENQGYGMAIRSGIRAARYPYLFFTDADLQFDVRELRELVAHVPNFRAVLGYRAKRKDPFMRLLNAWGWNMLNRFLFGLKVKDIDCAFKLFERKMVAELPLRARGAMISAEILIRLSRAGVRFKEVPVTHLPRTRGSPTGAKLSVIIRALNEMKDLWSRELGRRESVEFVKFSLVGVINTSIDLGFYFVMTRLLFFGSAPVLAKGISYLTATVFSFIANRVFTFGKKTVVQAGEVTRFYVSVALALGINTGATFLFINVLHFYDLVAAALATLCTIIFNFTALKYWVYREASVPAEAEAPVRSRVPGKV